MTPLHWYSKVRLLGWLAGISWRVFCYASDYPARGHVCDWAHYDPLPCALLSDEAWPTEVRDFGRILAVCPLCLSLIHI